MSFICGILLDTIPLIYLDQHKNKNKKKMNFL